MYQNAINLTCIPFNFAQLEAINQKTGDLDTTLLYAMLQFQIQHSKLSCHGTKTIARSREQLAQFFGLTPSKIDTMIKMLEKLSFIRKTVGTWFRKKRLFISVTDGIPNIEVHFRKLAFLNKYTGSVKASLLWARIAFALNNSTIQHNGITWCSIKRDAIANLLCVSLRTADKIIDDLIKKELIIAQHLVRNGKRCLHFTIAIELHNKIAAELEEWLSQKPKCAAAHTPQETIHNTVTETIKETLEDQSAGQNKNNILPKKEPNAAFCREEPAKMEKSIRLKNKDQYKNNNTTVLRYNCKKEPFDNSDINLNNIDTQLTYRQLCFLAVAFKKTVRKAHLSINEEEILEEIKFSILNPEQRKGISGFKHAVSRCMKILRERNWRTPLGFHRYSEYGQAVSSARQAHFQAHEIRKREECNRNPGMVEYHTREETTQGVRWAQQLNIYIAEFNSSGQKDDSLAAKIEFAANKVLEFINKGADKVVIKPYLPAEMSI